MNTNKFILFPAVTVTFCFCLGVLFLSSFRILPAGSQGIISSLSKKPVVVIDAGHGGSDPGKIGTVGTKEKDINLSIALRLQKLLTAQDIQVVMTRDEDIELAPEADNRKLSDMKERIALITREEADVVISIHQNSYTSPQVYGAQCFYYSSSPEGKTLAGMLQQQIVLTTGQTKVREIKENSDYYLLKHSPSPCVIVECGFLSCPEEEQLLTTGDYQEKLAWAIHLAVLRYLNQT